MGDLFVVWVVFIVSLYCCVACGLYRLGVGWMVPLGFGGIMWFMASCLIIAGYLIWVVMVLWRVFGWIGLVLVAFVLGVYRFCVCLVCLGCGPGSVLVFGGFCCSALRLVVLGSGFVAWMDLFGFDCGCCCGLLFGGDLRGVRCCMC